jgi:hypothetical protein
LGITEQKKPVTWAIHDVIPIFPFGGFFDVTQHTAFGFMISKYKVGRFV